MIARQLVAIAVLPCTVTVVVPLWIARDARVPFAAPTDAASAAFVLGGLLCLAVGLWLFVTTVALFWTRGKGTLAPWDPPRVFVADGPYRYVRNPMISGVVFILIAEASIVRSRSLAEWAALFFAINVIYIPLVEEPMLAARFGDSYREYTRHVRMFVPRLTPWQQ
jgi:protein-S-isoprenylcysteine O-methyltransferase Ste14